MTHVIITGGSSGIGLCVARLYAARGAQISLIARTRSILMAACADLANGLEATVHAEVADVREEADLAAAIARCEAVHGPCDILVASAGIVSPGVFAGQENAVFDNQMKTNFSGAVHAVRAVYPRMKRRGEGRIMLVSSGAGLMGIYGYSAYCASKFALRGFAQALRAEARPHGIAVSICFPPDTLTPQLAAERRDRPPEAQVVMGAVKPWDARDVARQMVAGIDKGRFEVFFSWTLFLLARFGPMIGPLLDVWIDWTIRKTARSKR